MKLKKLALILSASLITVCSVSFSVYADEEVSEEETAAEESVTDEDDGYLTTEDGNYKYSFESSAESGEKYVVLEEYLGNEESVVIPEEIDGIKVTKIGDYAFNEKEFIKNITISKNIEDFGDYTFYGSTSITEFKVDEENEIYKADESGAIVGKDGLAYFVYPCGKNPTEITIPDGTVAIQSSAFAVCKELKTVNLPDSLEYIGSFCFAECESLDNVVIPDGVTTLEQYTFSGCKSLKNITLPDTMTLIGDAAFFECESMTEFTFPASLTEIGQGAFVSTGFKTIEIPATVISIGYSAFGFTTDQTHEIIAVDGFSISGYSGSYAQSYCTENGIEFIEIEPANTDTGKNSSESKVKPGVVISICIAAAVIIIVVIVFVKKVKNYDYDDENEGDYDDYKDDSEESENNGNE